METPTLHQLRSIFEAVHLLILSIDGLISYKSLSTSTAPLSSSSKELKKVSNNFFLYMKIQKQQQKLTTNLRVWFSNTSFINKKYTQIITESSYHMVGFKNNIKNVTYNKFSQIDFLCITSAIVTNRLTFPNKSVFFLKKLIALHKYKKQETFS